MQRTFFKINFQAPAVHPSGPSGHLPSRGGKKVPLLGFIDKLRSLPLGAVTQENDGSAVEFWRIKHSERPPSHQGLRGRSSHFLHPKFWGRTAKHRKGADFDADARKNTEGTLGGCRGGLTPQPRKSGPFTASFSYATAPLAGAFLFGGDFFKICCIFRAASVLLANMMRYPPPPAPRSFAASR